MLNGGSANTRGMLSVETRSNNSRQSPSRTRLWTRLEDDFWRADVLFFSRHVLGMYGLHGLSSISSCVCAVFLIVGPITGFEILNQSPIQRMTLSTVGTRYLSMIRNAGTQTAQKRRASAVERKTGVIFCQCAVGSPAVKRPYIQSGQRWIAWCKR